MNSTSAKNPFLVLLLMFMSWSAFAQLPAFTLTATSTPQTCLGNGTLSFAVGNTTPSAGITYAVYLLPNTTTPLVTVSATTVTGLVAGDYQVVATQTLNGQSSTATANITIVNNVIPLTYTLTPTNIHCGGDGKIAVNVTAGTAVSYEIVSGPVTRPLQTTNVFSNLPIGLYVVRVYDSCGEAVVVSLQLVQELAGIFINNVTFPGGELPSCTTIFVSNLYSNSAANTAIFFPITLQYTVHPPGGGAAVIVTQTVAAGGTTNEAIGTIPFYYNQQYTYDLKITDACGNIFTHLANVVNQKFTIDLVPDYPNCTDKTLEIKPDNYRGPYTVTFTQSPAGFNPLTYNAQHPVFQSGNATYGSPGNPLPDGTYTVSVTDACGHTATGTVDIMIPPAIPMTDGTAVCGQNTGTITITVPNRMIASVTITAAPAAYTGAVPQDLSAFINQLGVFILPGVPLGNYTFTVTDNCGEVHPANVTVAPTAGDPNVALLQRPGCDTGIGSVRMYSNDAYVSVMITAAPASFGQTLPYNASANINPTGTTAGQFYMNSLPEGTYTFVLTDNCNFARTQTINVTGYHETQNDFTVIPHCGSFDLDFDHVSNSSYVESFWLQKYDPVTNTWGHPLTGVPYTSGLPNASNSVFLNDNDITINLAYTGQFRVLKNFYIYSNGSSANFRCSHEVYNFTYDGGPEITNAYSFPCGQGLTEVALEVTGVPPFTYKITTKDGVAFLVNNGASNLFSGLEPATYNFQVTDNCGNVRNRAFTINQEQPIAITPSVFCEGQPGTLSVTEFSFLTYTWYKQGSPSAVLSTTGTLTFPAFNSAANAGTYVLVIAAQNPDSCLNQTLIYTITPNTLPNAGADNADVVCNTGTVIDLTAYLAATHDNGGAWQDVDGAGGLAGNLFSTTGVGAGTYHFTYTVTGMCSSTDVATITLQLKDVPAAPAVPAVAGVCVGANVQLSATAVAGATYSWTGPANFTSSVQNPLLTNVAVANAGDYHLTVTVNGCTSAAATVSVGVSPAPFAGADGSAAVCNNGTAIALSSYLGTGYQANGTWSDNDNSGALAGDTFSPATVAAGTYHFTYTVTSFCNTSDAATVTVTLNNIPVAPALTQPAAVCEGTDVTVNVAPQPGVTYAWTGPNGFASSAQNLLLPAAAVSATGTYTLVVTANGCPSAPVTVPVTINANPQFVIQGNTVLCDGQSTELTVVPGNFSAGNATYKWYYNNDLQTNLTTATIQATETGNYEVAVATAGCETLHEITVLPNTNPFALIPDAGCVNEAFMLSVANIDTIADVASIEWTGPAGYNHSGATADITDLPTGDYVVTVTNADGCSATETLTIDNTKCFIPKGISPGNGDNLNNTFDLSNLGVQHLEIFNRYGMQVYEKDNYVNEWYGQSDKGDLPTGTYFYVVTLSAGKQKTGWVYLMKEVH